MEELPKEFEGPHGPVPGFAYADQIHKQDQEESLEQEEKHVPRRRVEINSEKPRVDEDVKEFYETVNSLREALEWFSLNLPDARRAREVALDGTRIGAIYINEEDGELVRYLVMFKREPYYHFAKHFKRARADGYGMVCNYKLVNWCSLQGIHIAAVMKNSKCYWIDAYKFYKYFEKYNTEVEHLPGEIACPLKMWKRLF